MPYERRCHDNLLWREAFRRYGRQLTLVLAAPLQLCGLRGNRLAPCAFSYTAQLVVSPSSRTASALRRGGRVDRPPNAGVTSDDPREDKCEHDEGSGACRRRRIASPSRSG